MTLRRGHGREEWPPTASELQRGRDLDRSGVRHELAIANIVYGGHNPVLFASCEQVSQMADIVERVADDVSELWISVAVRLLDQEGWEITPDLVGELGNEVRRVLEHLPRYLRRETTGGNGYSPRSLQMLVSRAPGGMSELGTVLFSRLYAMLVHCMMMVVAAHLPEEWPARVGIDLHLRVANAIQDIAGLTPARLLAALEASILAQRERLKRATAHLTSAQEEERQRIARDIHDALAQELAAATTRTQVAQQVIKTAPHKATQEIERAQSLVKEALGRVRDIIFDLRPVSLERLGLREAVADYADHISAGRSLNITVGGNGDVGALDLQLQAMLFRVIQEALSNIYKHSRATEASVTINVGPAQVEVEVRDNGCGFDVGKLHSLPQAGRHCGIFFLRERVALAGGELDIDSQVGRGTILKIKVPH